jgi:putative membrane protein
MHSLANIFVGFVALLHTYFLVLEMFLWTKPLGLKVFRQTLEKAQSSQALAANQGLYNGFLVAGLLWSLNSAHPTFALHLKTFFLSCVIVAGVFGAVTVNKRIFFFQALPALVALVLLWV